MITTKSRDRFFKKVEKAEGGCWLWLAGKSPGGYGKFSVCRMTVAAHRFSYLIAHGEISSLTIDHLCRNRACVNPVHLEQVPIRENILRGEGLAAINARKDSCDREHPFNEKNLRVSPNGHGGTYRACRKCEAIDMKKSRASNPNIKTYLNDYSQGYREAHREELRASAKKRYYEQREQCWCGRQNIARKTVKE